MNLIFPETRVIGLHFLPLIVWVYLHSNLCSELQKTHLFCNRVKSASRKRILTSNNHSRSFKVIHFAINHRPTRGSISTNNIVDHISEVSEEVAVEIARNCRRRQPHSYLTPPPRGTPANIRIHLIFPETKITGLHFCR